jgi:hypothetical protein
MLLFVVAVLVVVVAAVVAPAVVRTHSTNIYLSFSRISHYFRSQEGKEENKEESEIVRIPGIGEEGQAVDRTARYLSHPTTLPTVNLVTYSG